jgi:putative ABC transport system permease protein
MLRDLAYSVRTLRRAPAFSVAAVLTLAITIGANTTLLSVVDQVLLRPLPYTDAGRLFNVYERNQKGGLRLPSYPAFRDLQQQTRALSGMAYVRGAGVVLSTPEGPERMVVAWVTPGFFNVLGARAEIGRVFSADEEQGRGATVGVVSHKYWLSHFGGDRSVIGRTIRFDDQSVQLIGVMPLGVAFPDFADVWTPIAPRIGTDAALASRFLHSDGRVIGRLAPGVTREKAIAELTAIEGRLTAEYPEPGAVWNAGELSPVSAEVIGNAAPMMLILAGAVIVVLLIACLNVSNLSLVRAIGREREMAVRIALGATRVRLAWQLFAESLVIGLTSGAIGVLFTVWAIKTLRARAPGGLPRAAELTVDARVLGIALALSIVAAVLVGFAPALRRNAGRVAEQLRDGRQGGGGGVRGASVRNVLSVAQLALAIALLVSAGLLVESFQRVQRVDLGFDPEHLLGFQLAAPAKYAKATDAAGLYRRTLDVIGALPGVTSVGFINHPPLTGGYVPTHMVVPGRSGNDGTDDSALYATVSGAYFRTAGIRLLRGRLFTDVEVATAGDGIVVSEGVAKHFWADRDPIGQAITVFASSQARPDFGESQPSHVIGVVADVRHFGQGVDAPMEVYLPYTRETWPFVSILVRASGDPMALAPALRTALRTLDPDIIIGRGSGAQGFTSMSDALSQSLGTRLYIVRMLGAFAACALLLALIGVYGVIAYSVSQRTHEIGLRMALGADPRTVFLMVLLQAVRLAAVGVAVGVAVTIAATRLLQSQLYGTSATDPVAIGVAALAVVATVLAASVFPAMRAARLDPTMAMRG